MSHSSKMGRDIDKRALKAYKQRQAIYNSIDAQFRAKNAKKEKNKGLGPNMKFKNYYQNYIETKLNGAEITAMQTIEIIKDFLNEEENEILKRVYTVEDILNWVPKKERKEEENER